MIPKTLRYNYKIPKIQSNICPQAAGRNVIATQRPLIGRAGTMVATLMINFVMAMTTG